MEKWLSLWSIGQEGELKDFPKIKQAGFDGVEIWGEHLNAEAYLDYAKTCNLKIGLHLPFHDFNLATPDAAVKDRMLDINTKWIQKLAEYGGEHAVIHGGLVRSSEEHSETIKYVKERLKALNSIAKENHVELLLENLIPDKLNYTHVVASDLEEWEQLLMETGTKACLDTGHLAVMQNPLKETILQLGESLRSVHYSDNDGKADLHLIPGEGDCVGTELFKILEEVNYQGPVIYELNPYKYSLDRILDKLIPQQNG